MVRPAHLLRVFTRGNVGGNHLGVINDIMGLDDASMQQIATDLGFPETTFVDWGTRNVPKVRIFTPTMELPFAGHPMVGTAWVMTFLGPLPHAQLECGVGIVDVNVEGDVVKINTALNQPVHLKPDLSIPEAAGLPQPERAWTVLMPKPYLVLQYSDSATITGLEPDFDKLDGIFGTACFARNETRAHMRFFAPSAGIPEDPATGSAAVAVAAAHGASGLHEGQLTIDQGAEVGTPSRIELSWTETMASIGGTVIHDGTKVV